MTSSDEKKIEAAKKKYAEATTDAERAAAHAEAEAVRANYGYSGGEDGSQNIKLSSSKGEWISDKSKAKDSYNENEIRTNNNSGYTDTINALMAKQKEWQQKSIANQLKAKREQTLQSLAEQEAEIQPKYYEAKRQANATSTKQARNFAEYLANRGLTNSGAAAQGEINRQGALMNTLGRLGTAEAQEYGQIARARQNAEQNYITDLANANAQIESEYYKNLLAEEQKRIQEENALKQQALYQYGDDYQARINELLAQGYNPNSREILTLQALRGQKIANMQSGANYNYAMQQIQNGNINYNNAIGAGFNNIEEARAYYNDYIAQLQAQAQMQAQQQALENSYKNAQINNIYSQIQDRQQQRQLQAQAQQNINNPNTVNTQNPQEQINLIDKVQEEIDKVNNLSVLTEENKNKKKVRVIIDSDLSNEEAINLLKENNLPIDEFIDILKKEQGASERDIQAFKNYYDAI